MIRNISRGSNKIAIIVVVMAILFFPSVIATLNNNGFTLTSSGNNYNSGFNITVNKENICIESVTTASGETAANAYIIVYNSTYPKGINVLSAAFSSNVATFSPCYNVTLGQKLGIVAGIISSTGNEVHKYTTTASFPVTGAGTPDINWTSGIQNQSGGWTGLTTTVFAIQSINTSLTNTSIVNSLTYSGISKSSDRPGLNVNFNVSVLSTGTLNLTNCTPSFDNGTGVFYNLSTITLTGQNGYCGFTVFVNSSVGSTIRYKWYLFAKNSSLTYQNETITTSYTTSITPNGTSNFIAYTYNPVGTRYYAYEDETTAKAEWNMLPGQTIGGVQYIDMWYHTNTANNYIAYWNGTNPYNFSDGSGIRTNLTGYASPAVIVNDSKYLMYVAKSSDNDIYAFTSTDKVNWTPACGGSALIVGLSTNTAAAKIGNGIYIMVQQQSGTWNVVGYNTTDGCTLNTIGTILTNEYNPWFTFVNGTWVFAVSSPNSSNYNLRSYKGNTLANMSYDQTLIQLPSQPTWDLNHLGDGFMYIIPSNSSSYYDKKLYYFYGGNNSIGFAYDYDNRSFYEIFNLSYYESAPPTPPYNESINVKINIFNITNVIVQNNVTESHGASLITPESTSYLTGFNITTKYQNLVINNVTLETGSTAAYIYVLDDDGLIMCRFAVATSSANCNLPTIGTYYVYAGSDTSTYNQQRISGCTSPITGGTLDFIHGSYSYAFNTSIGQFIPPSDSTPYCMNIKSISLTNSTSVSSLLVSSGLTYIRISNNSIGYNELFNTSNGTLETTLNKNTYYNITINNSGFSILYANITTPNISYQEYNFTLYNNNTIQISLYDEILNNYITWENITIEVISNSYSTNYTVNSNLNISFLVPNEYTLRYKGNNFVERDYYITVTGQSNDIITLYDLTNGNSTALNVIVKDTTGEAIESATVKLLRYYTSCNCYKVVQMAKTNFAGEGLFYVQAYIGHYKWIIEYNDAIVFSSTTPEQITSSQKTFVVDLGSDYYSSFKRLGSITHTVTYNNNTGVLTFTWNDPTNIVIMACLETTRINGTKYSIESLSCGTGSTGSTYVTLAHPGNITYKYNAYINTNTAYSNHILSSGIIGKAVQTFGGLGVFLSIGILITLSIMFSFSASAVMIINIIGIIVISGMGIFALSTSFIIALAAVTIGLIAFIMRT